MLSTNELKHLVIELDFEDVDTSPLLEIVLIAGVVSVMSADQGVLVERLLPQEVGGVVLKQIIQALMKEVSDDMEEGDTSDEEQRGRVMVRHVPVATPVHPLARGRR